MSIDAQLQFSVIREDEKTYIKNVTYGPKTDKYLLFDRTFW